MTVARRSGDDLGALGLDKRNIAGVIGQIKELGKEGKQSGEDVAKSMREAADKAGALGDVSNDVFDNIARGDYLKAFEKFKKGMADLQEGGLSDGLKGLLGAAVAEKLGRGLADATAKAIELKKAFDQGKISAGEMVEKAAGLVPVVGGWFEAGRNLRELFTGELAAIEAANEAIKRQNDLLEQQRGIRERNRDVNKDAKQHAEDEAKKTSDTIDDTKVKNLRNTGQTEAADALERKNKREREIRDFSEEERRRAREAKDRLNAPSQPGGLTVEAQANVSAAEARRARDDSNAAREKQAQTGSGDDLAEYVRLQKIAEEAETKAAQAGEQWALVKQQQQKIDEQSEKTIKERTKAVKDSAAADAAAAGNQKIGEKIKGIFENLKIKANPIVEWVKDQNEKAKKEMERLKGVAEKIADGIKTPADKLKADLGDAVAAAKAGKLGAGDLSKYFSNTRDDLMSRKADLEAGLNQRAYDLPDIKDASQAGTLYAAPNKNSEKSLKELEQIKEQLKVLNETAKNNGVDIQVVN